MFTFKTLFLCCVLEIGAFCGVPIRPVDIERALKLNQNAAVQVVESDRPAGPPLPEVNSTPER